jgi:two-component system OmpR family response regulator
MMARIVALFRRVDALSGPLLKVRVITTGDLSINIERMSIQWQSQALEITVTEFWVIHCLARHPGQVKSREQLMEAAKVVLDDNTITSHIKRIRKKFLAIDAGFNAINTAYGLGYRWHV